MISSADDGVMFSKLTSRARIVCGSIIHGDDQGHIASVYRHLCLVDPK